MNNISKYIVKEKDKYFPVSNYKNYTTQLLKIKIESIDLDNNNLNLRGYFRLSSSQFRFRSFKLYLIIENDKRVELPQILYTDLRNEDKCNNKNKQSFIANIINYGYSTTVDNRQEIDVDFNFSNINICDISSKKIKSLKIEVDYFYNLFLLSKERGYQEFIICNNLNINNYIKHELEDNIDNIEMLNLDNDKSYFYKNLLDEYSIILNDKNEIKLKYNLNNDEFRDIETDNIYSYFYSNDLGNLFYNYENEYSLLIKILNNKVKRVIINNGVCDTEYLFSYYDCSNNVINSNIILCLKNDCKIEVKKCKWCNNFIKENLNNNLNLDNLRNFYKKKKLLFFKKSDLNLEIENLSDIENYEVISESGSKLGRLVIRYKDYLIDLDFSKLSSKNVGLNIVNLEKFIVIYNLRFYGSGGIGDISISPNNIPCFTKTCYINTPCGFTNVTKLKKGDIVLTQDERKVKICNVFTSRLTSDLEKPYVIYADSYGENLPILDTYISRRHQYKLNGKWTTPEKEKLPQKWLDDILVYYHIETPEYLKDNLIVNGLEMESWDGKIPLDIKNKK